ncbi:MAG: cell division ATP-binding protein FtsE [Phenylobacterium sp.]|uniref:cell division ATP-binding protein FtsE n=1 Tax=Phenylobacterium sp. TaxID=1871053 RepID=UPI0027268545|nr:cell division ATP-binding protein FtsE [Phenylobacterium sp.]MDO9245113.1 cell division ATP-binding protein FtsE [Phenylobacterium sp.]MDP2011492.1 cell division ATP-binding protein FtsE [Phenylobacterium sp.]MDP3632768.1 cell division ATP-binding protein FtsE [Phenylobacterium sp.]MDP3868808.1 cell division ATP-binding protein FtsE [Phenylobacterium sp.]HQT54305.1 cell division ATP-binding protein FtsE [Phenylobacterium sp.]
MSRQPHDEQALDADDAILAFDDVSMRYGRGPETLKDLTFSLEPGSFHFLTGASGAGKSSLLKLIYLAAKPSKGLMHLFGQDVSAVPPKQQPMLRRRIGVVFQEFRLLDHMSAFDNVALPLRIAGRKPDSYRQDVAELLAWVGLRSRMHAMPATLAGGEKQRLAIARAVVNRPDILLADEPTGNVDHEMGLRILRLFVELNRLGTTVLIATHDQDLVARSGKPVLHLEDGRLTQLGPIGGAS